MLPPRTLLYNAFWGIDPPSLRRRLKAQFYYWLPLVVMIKIWVGASCVITGMGSVSEDILFALFFSFTISSVGIHILRLSLTDDLQRFRQNWGELRLAGVSPRDYLWSHARLRFSSGILVSVFAAIPFIAICLMHPSWLSEWGFWLSVPLMLIEPAFLLTGGILVDVASWTKPGRFFGRVGTLVVMFLIGPGFILLTGFQVFYLLKSMNIPLHGFDEITILKVTPPFFIPAFLLRIGFIRSQWKKAIARLDGELCLPFS